jgi:hypothetical protein
VADVEVTLDSSSSTFRSESRSRAYIIPTRRMTSGDESKYRNGLVDLAMPTDLNRRRYRAAKFGLTMPLKGKHLTNPCKKHDNIPL